MVKVCSLWYRDPKIHWNRVSGYARQEEHTIIQASIPLPVLRAWGSGLSFIFAGLAVTVWDQEYAGLRISD